MQRLIDANAVKENHKRWIGYLDDDMIGRMNFAIDHHVPTVLTIPDNPTNGDIVKAMFPTIESRLDEHTGIMLAKWADGTTKTFKADWWNSPYKRGDTDGSANN